MLSRVAFWVGIAVILAHVTLQSLVWGAPIVIYYLTAHKGDPSGGSLGGAFEVWSENVSHAMNISMHLSAWLYIVVLASCIGWIIVAAMLIRRAKWAVPAVFCLTGVLCANSVVVYAMSTIQNVNYSELILFYLIVSVIFATPGVRKIAKSTI